jgi:hypothetical protein
MTSYHRWAIIQESRLNDVGLRRDRYILTSGVFRGENDGKIRVDDKTGNNQNAQCDVINRI